MVWEQTTWWYVGAMAMVFTGMSFLGLRDRVIALVIADVAAMLLWFIWAINAFAVEELSETGVATIHNYPSLGYWAFGFGVVMLLDLFLVVLGALTAGSGADTESDTYAT